MPSIKQELETTRTAHWYQAARNAQATMAQGERVAQRAHYAPAEPPYTRWGRKQDEQPAGRMASGNWAGKPGPALVAEAKITAFWPYREGVIKIADAFDMAPIEWAAAYLRALAAWARDNRPLAACHPAPPECVVEDMTVLVASRGYSAGETPARIRAARLRELACKVVGLMLDDASITPRGAFSSVRDEVHELLTAPCASLADRVVRAVTDLSGQITHQGTGDDILTADQAGQLLRLLNGLGSLLAGFATPCQEPALEPR